MIGDTFAVFLEGSKDCLEKSHTSRTRHPCVCIFPDLDRIEGLFQENEWEGTEKLRVR